MHLGQIEGTRYPILKQLLHKSSLGVDTRSYRNYSLTGVSQHLGFHVTDKNRNYVIRMALTLSSPHISGEDRIMVADFQTKFVRKTNIQKIFVAQAVSLFSHPLTDLSRASTRQVIQ